MDSVWSWWRACQIDIKSIKTSACTKGHTREEKKYLKREKVKEEKKTLYN